LNYGIGKEALFLGNDATGSKTQLSSRLSSTFLNPALAKGRIKEKKKNHSILCLLRAYGLVRVNILCQNFYLLPYSVPLFRILLYVLEFTVFLMCENIFSNNWGWISFLIH
jgi:hypothetical protein